MNQKRTRCGMWCATANAHKKNITALLSCRNDSVTVFFSKMTIHNKIVVCTMRREKMGCARKIRQSIARKLLL